LWASGIALERPDTDVLTGQNRQNNGTGTQLSDAGLKAHGLLWASAVDKLREPGRALIVSVRPDQNISD